MFEFTHTLYSYTIALITSTGKVNNSHAVRGFAITCYSCYLQLTTPTFWWWCPVGCSWGWVQWVCTSLALLANRGTQLRVVLSTCKMEERHLLQTLWGCTVGGMTSLYIQSVNYQKGQELIYNIGVGKGIGLNKMHNYIHHNSFVWVVDGNSTSAFSIALKTLPVRSLIVELWPFWTVGRFPTLRADIIVMKLTFSMHAGAVLLYRKWCMWGRFML